MRKHARDRGGMDEVRVPGGGFEGWLDYGGSRFGRWPLHRGPQGLTLGWTRSGGKRDVVINGPSRLYRKIHVLHIYTIYPVSTPPLPWSCERLVAVC